MQYDTHTNWRTEEERTDRGGAKSAVACTYNDDATMMMHSLTFQAHHGEVCTHVVVGFDLDAGFGRHMALM